MDEEDIAQLAPCTILYISPCIGETPADHRGVSPLALMAYDQEDRARVRSTRKGMDSDRRQQVKACIVRFLKDLKRAPEAELISKVREKLAEWFLLQDADVVASIASLVENEYVEYKDGYCAYVA